MKLNISNPKVGTQEVIEIEKENDLRFFYGKSLRSKFQLGQLGTQIDGCLLKINGGQDKQGFPLRPGVLTNRRIRLLLGKNSIGCRGYGFKKGEVRRKSVRGCIISPEVELLNVSILKEKKSTIDLISISKKKFSLFKRASKLRKFYVLSKEVDLRKHIVKKTISSDKNSKQKRPKIQRLITPIWIQRKKMKLSKKKKRIRRVKIQLTEYGKRILI